MGDLSPKAKVSAPAGTHRIKKGQCFCFFISCLSALAAGLIPVSGARGADPTLGFFVLPTGGNWNEVDLGTEFTSIQTMSLPAGKYIANAQAVVASSDLQVRLVDCMLTLDGIRRGEVASGMIGGQFNSFATLALTAGFRLDATGVLGVACRADVANHVVSQPTPITAISLDHLQIQKGIFPTPATAKIDSLGLE